LPPKFADPRDAGFFMPIARTRGRKLQTLRKRVFDQQPLCGECERQGRITPATQLDHIVPVHKGGTDDRGNLEPLCDNCHADKTARDMGYARVPVGVDGYPLRGHWWCEK